MGIKSYDGFGPVWTIGPYTDWRLLEEYLWGLLFRFRAITTDPLNRRRLDVVEKKLRYYRGVLKNIEREDMELIAEQFSYVSAQTADARRAQGDERRRNFIVRYLRDEL